MQLYIDEDASKQSLIQRLRQAGHNVQSAADAGLLHATDARQLAHAIEHDFVLLTRNDDDFQELHDLILIAAGHHSGVLVVRSDNDPARDMTDRAIVTAVANLESSGVPIADEVHYLNQWR